MARRQDVVCRDFQRGTCRFGAHCKFLHQQQPGFGRQNQAVQAPVQAPEHRCNDPRACKERIRDDFTNERPSYWRLTCYAHWKHLPNDISGDTSFEELRAMAYESALQGMPLRDITSREAYMFRAKEAEFDALKRDPYKGPASKGFSNVQPSPLASSTIFGKLVPNNSPISQMFKQDTNMGGFGNGPVISPPQQIQPAAFSFPSPSPFPAQSVFPQNPQSPSPFTVQQPSPFNPVSSFGNNNAIQNAFSPLPAPAIVQSPFQQPSVSPPTAAVLPITPEETATWGVEQWELGQIPEDEPPVAVR
ncbi:zinc finger CCCH domain-containing protein 16 [Selaginella moellendorffii]|uniref:zinc finger CCCH domain-containing protein 16 n=1 Tax=Selaginella moellendorffii TaxID=88036 RepID=UPI000D1C3F63|nr:zinc finger CCCH domain-containing protein 16 [Selaginella moellendorffii]|eukprot:XP_024526072.1 zinc finger CCCH domain-containing protein 16 [Selaginella moellendorffii]